MWINLSEEMPPAGLEPLRVGFLDYQERIQPWGAPSSGEELHKYVYGPLAGRRTDTRIVWWREAVQP